MPDPRQVDRLQPPRLIQQDHVCQIFWYRLPGVLFQSHVHSLRYVRRHVISAVTICPPHFFLKFVTLCPPSQNVRPFFEKIITLWSPLQKFRIIPPVGSASQQFPRVFDRDHSPNYAKLWQLGSSPVKVNNLYNLLINYPDRKVEQLLAHVFEREILLNYHGPRINVEYRSMKSVIQPVN